MLKNYAMIALLILLSLSGLTQADDTDGMGIILKNSFMIGTCTDSPCLFGQSLKGMNFDHVHRIIANSNLRDSLILVESPVGSITWVWSPEAAPTFGIDFYPESLTYDDYARLISFGASSGVGFRDGEANIVSLSFVTELHVLVEVYGEPLFVAPFTYDRYGNMDFLITFPDVEGYFIASTRCEKPELL